MRIPTTAASVLTSLACLGAITPLAAAAAAAAGTSPDAPVVSVSRSDPLRDVYTDGTFTRAERRTVDLTGVRFVVNRETATFRAVLTMRDLRRHVGDTQFFDVLFMEPGQDDRTGHTLRFPRNSGHVQVTYLDDEGSHVRRCKAAEVTRRWKKESVAVRAPLRCVGSPARAEVQLASVLNNFPQDGVVDIAQDEARFKTLRMTMAN